MIIAWICGELHDVTKTLPISFSNSNYVVNGPVWIDQVMGINLQRTVSTISLTCIIHHGWALSGITIIGY